VCGLWLPNLCDCRNDLSGYADSVASLVSRHVELLPRVHLVISHLKRWMMGTHQGAISQKHLDYYLNEFTFRFNRRRSKSRGKLFSGSRCKLWQSIL
jgi:hypothetical protein